MKVVIIADSSSANKANNESSYIEDIYTMCMSNYEEVFVVCPEDTVEQISQLVPLQNIIPEPYTKGTATAIGLAAAYFANQNPTELLTFIFANQRINNQHRLIATLRVAQDVYEQLKTMLLIGVAITSKTRDYGYVKVGKVIQEVSGIVTFEMLGFERNPSPEKIEDYLKSWQYLWDTGCMLCSAEGLLAIYQDTIPELFTGLMTIKAALGTKFEKEILDTVYKSFAKESVAKGLYEKIDPKKILVLPVDLGIKEYF